jgi:hypothetical protein
MFEFNREYFDPSFSDELQVREQIQASRNQLLSFVTDVVARTMRLEKPKLAAYGKLPSVRTGVALGMVLKCLRAFDELAPGIIDPEAQFTGFLAALRYQEQETLSGQTTDELTVLAQLLSECLDLDYDNKHSSVVVEDGFIIVSAEALSEVLRKKAKEQGIHLKGLNAVNTGRWLSSEVGNSSEFTAEKVNSGTGNKKRNVWKIGRRP